MIAEPDELLGARIARIRPAGKSGSYKDMTVILPPSDFK